MKVKYVLFLLTLGLGFSACSDDETVTDEPVNGESYVSLNFNPVVAEENKSQKAQESQFTFTSGNIVIDDLIFVVSQDGESVEVQVTQGTEELVRVDLATGTTSPAIEDFTIPSGTYNQVEVEMALNDENPEENPSVEGYFTDAEGNRQPVRLEFPAGETITLQREGDFVFAELESLAAEVTLNPTSWVGEVSNDILNSLETNEEGVIVINEEMNENVLAIVLDHLEDASEVEVTREDS